ncbi:CDP-alcohol phosphatidyltransferase family protein [uncultured Alsobacter sp.]|uniref:CDP-alcohol phosphatidyltransferase family protein n=1 Tax=uncultured Alsobacter sp. TaxID=1748258 RepID=UPI0025F7B530|nr:CDP-alcohol phosphatidyltransferase family protein [uncultured Alsobacter sp.]
MPVNLPNIITIGRLFLVPFVVAMILRGQWSLAFFAFLLAGISDAVDGFIARRFDMRSELGAYLDPLADKALLVSIYITLSVVAVMPSWMAIVVVSRDLMIVGAVVLSWVLSNPVIINPSRLSKLNTAAQIALAGLVLGAHAFAIEDDVYLDQLLLVVAALTTASAAHYLAQWLRHMTS